MKSRKKSPKVGIGRVTFLLLFLLVSSIPHVGAPSPTYHTHEVLVDKFKALCDKYPTHASYESIGRTYEGKEIWIFKIGNPNGGRVLWDGCLHGWEDQGSEIEYLIAEWLLESGQETARRILDYNYVLFIPVVNMDSYERQNKNFESCPWGVDLNRNFYTGWRRKETNDYDYPGSYAGSEPETRAMCSVFQTYRPNFYVNTHYGGGPWLGYYSLSNSTLVNSVITRINEISDQIGVTPYTIRSVGSDGHAVGDAYNFGACAWLLETDGGEGCYSHTAHSYEDVVNLYFPKCLPIFIAMCEACGSSSPLPPPDQLSIFRTVSTSGQIRYPNGQTESEIELTINPRSQVMVNDLNVAVKLDHEWKVWRDSITLRNLAEDAGFKIVNCYTAKDDSPDPCIYWDEDSMTGTWDWTDIDLLAQRIIEIGAEPMFSLCLYNMEEKYLPRGMSINPKTGLPYSNQFASYCAAWVNHFKDSGIPVRYYEINEEGFEYFGWNGAYGLNKLLNYIEVWNAAAREMRSVNPEIMISDDSITMRVVFDAWLEYGDDVDFLSFHKYDSFSLSQSDSGYKTDIELLELAEKRCYDGSSSFYGVEEARQKWLEVRGKLLPIMNHESNLNGHWRTGTDERIRQMIGAVWHAIVLRVSVLNGLSHIFYYSFATSQSNNFGMVNKDTGQLHYPYYVYSWLGNNLSPGDVVLESYSTSSEIQVLTWKHGETLNIFLISTVNELRSVALHGITGEITLNKVDDTTATVQTSIINANDILYFQGYTVALLQMSPP